MIQCNAFLLDDDALLFFIHVVRSFGSTANLSSENELVGTRYLIFIIYIRRQQCYDLLLKMVDNELGDNFLHCFI